MRRIDINHLLDIEIKSRRRKQLVLNITPQQRQQFEAFKQHSSVK
jgi:hypothetical protein